MKKYIAPLFFALMIIVPVTWGIVSARLDKTPHINTKDVEEFKHMMYVVDTAKYMPQVRWIRSLSDSALFEILRKYPEKE